MQDVKSLTDAGDFGSFGRYEEVPIAQMAPEMKEAYDYTMQLRGIVPGPHKIWLANAALSRTIVPIGAYYQKQSTLTKAEIEIVTVLTNARWHSAYGTYEHEKIAEKLGHIPAKTTECLDRGACHQSSAMLDSRWFTNSLARWCSGQGRRRWRVDKFTLSSIGRHPLWDMGMSIGCCVGCRWG